MRATLLFLLLLIPSSCVAQVEEHPRLSPEWKAFYAKQDEYRSHGKAALQAEYDREKTGDCPKAMTTYEINACLGAENDRTQANYLAYVRALGGLLRLSAPGSRSAGNPEPPNVGKELDTAEATWVTYRESQCKAGSDQYFGGTMMTGAYLGCRLNLTRRHMHELESLYSDLWN